MTESEALGFLDRGHASRSDLSAFGWQIALEIGGELEWFSVTEQDAQRLETADAIRRGETDEGDD